ncbi:hypothetical protein BJV78DRAFT_1155769 [Lactifluus subvellereus]|nr:hypothetical protein BJV78DRAFT_1155769 [Lactifluus subvellereus]
MSTVPATPTARHPKGVHLAHRIHARNIHACRTCLAPSAAITQSAHVEHLVRAALLHVYHPLVGDAAAHMPSSGTWRPVSDAPWPWRESESDARVGLPSPGWVGRYRQPFSYREAWPALRPLDADLDAGATPCPLDADLDAGVAPFIVLADSESWVDPKCTQETGIWTCAIICADPPPAESGKSRGDGSRKVLSYNRDQEMWGPVNIGRRMSAAGSWGVTMWGYNPIGVGLVLACKGIFMDQDNLPVVQKRTEVLYIIGKSKFRESPPGVQVASQFKMHGRLLPFFPEWLLKRVDHRRFMQRVTLRSKATTATGVRSELLKELQDCRYYRSVSRSSSRAEGGECASTWWCTALRHLDARGQLLPELAVNMAITLYSGPRGIRRHRECRITQGWGDIARQAEGNNRRERSSNTYHIRKAAVSYPMLTKRHQGGEQAGLPLEMLMLIRIVTMTDATSREIWAQSQQN